MIYDRNCWLNKRIILLVGAMLIPVLLLAGCGKSGHQEQIDKTVAKLKGRPARPIEPLPVVQPLKKEIYQAAGLRNPFMRPQEAKKGVAQPDVSRPKGPLESYPLDALKMVGTITQNGKIWALISAPDGTIYPVSTGAYLGQHFGRIVKITAKEVQLVESVQIGGEWQKRKTAITLTE